MRIRILVGGLLLCLMLFAGCQRQDVAGIAHKMKEAADKLNTCTGEVEMTTGAGADAKTLYSKAVAEKTKYA